MGQRLDIQTLVKALLLASLFLRLTATAIEPANPNANAKARAILNYFQSLGSRPDKRLVCGQFVGFGQSASLRLADRIHEQTGQWPALVGVDYADFEHGSLTSKAPNQAAIQYWKAPPLGLAGL
jgi:hypothetical protein